MICRSSIINLVVIHYLTLSNNASAFTAGISGGSGSSHQDTFSRQWISGALPGVTKSKTTELYAKKKKKGGKKKGGGNQKKSGFEWAQSFTLKPFEAKGMRELASIACASFEGRTGKPLFEDLKDSTDVPKTLWKSSMACIVVGAAKDTVEQGGLLTEMEVKYANVAALETVGLKEDEYTLLIYSSDQSKETDETKGSITVDLPAEMKGDKTYEGGYQKKILRDPSSEGALDISILNAQRWALEKSAFIDGNFVTENIGIAYAWEEWSIGKDTICRTGGINKSLAKTEDLKGKIEEQGSIIRNLKETMTNKDPEVQAAVAVLLKLKDQLVSLDL